MNLNDKIKSFIEKNKTEIALFLAFFCITILFVVSFFIFGVNFDKNIFPVLVGDSKEYIKLAENILNGNGFTLSNDFLNYEPESLRTPGYPAFLAIILFLFKNQIFISFIQIIMMAFCVVLVYKIALMFFDRKIALLSAIMMILEPSMSYYSSVVLSDTPAMFFFILALYVFLKYIKSEKNDIRLIFLSGFILGFTTLIRPISQFLPFVFLLYLVAVFYKTQSFKIFLKASVLFIFGFLLMISPWMTRNYIIFGSPAVSSISGYNLFMYNVSTYFAYKKNMDFSEVRDQMLEESGFNNNRSELKEFKTSQELGKAAMKYIKEDPFGYAAYHLFKTLPFFLTDNFASIEKIYFGGTSRLDHVNISGMIIRGQIKELGSIIKDEFKAADIGFFSKLFSVLFWSFIMFMSFFTIGKELYFKNKEKILFVLFCGALIAYFAVLTGPVANERYRLPVEPFMFILASVGIFFIIEKTKLYLDKKYAEKIA